jgi:alkylation response protein AidB-like acyl-CoA dehydrogenase
MEFGFTAEQEMIRRQAADFLKKECPTTFVRALMQDERGFDAALWKKMAAMGWLGLIFPEEHGGVGLTFVDLALVLEEMGRALAPGAYFSTVLMAGLVLLEAGSDEQKKKWLKPLIKGELKATLAITEPARGPGPAGICIRASTDDSGFLLNGTKLFVPDADVADLIVCVARTGEGSLPEEGITLFGVDRQSEGITVTPLKTLDMTRRLYEVILEQVHVPVDRVIGRAGRAWPVVESVLDKSMIGLCAEMVGGSQRVLDMCVEYSKSRIQFGRPIGSFQSIQHKCADMLLLTESARSAVYAAAWAASRESEDVALQASIAKAYTSDAYSSVAGEGIQIHGGMGFTWEHDAHLYFKRAKADEVMFGDASYHRERVAELIGL